MENFNITQANIMFDSEVRDCNTALDAAKLMNQITELFGDDFKSSCDFCKTTLPKIIDLNLPVFVIVDGKKVSKTTPKLEPVVEVITKPIIKRKSPDFTNLKFTAKEKELIQKIKGCDEYDGGVMFTWFDTGLSLHSAIGVLASLSRKGVICESGVNENFSYTCWYISQKNIEKVILSN